MSSGNIKAKMSPILPSVFKMYSWITFTFLLISTSASGLVKRPTIAEEADAAISWIREQEPEIYQRNHKLQVARWNYETNRSTKADLDLANEDHVRTSQQFNDGLNQFSYYIYYRNDQDIKRQLALHRWSLGDLALPSWKLAELREVVDQMQSKNQKMKPNFTDDLEENKEEWLRFYKRNAPENMKLYLKYLQFKTEAADSVGNSLTSAWWYWTQPYGGHKFDVNLEATIKEINDLYEQLHAFVRHKLREHYGKDAMSANGSIPLHLLRDIDQSDWTSLLEILVGNPTTTREDIEQRMIFLNYTSKSLFEKANDFFQGLNFTSLPENFWTESVYESTDQNCEPMVFDLSRFEFNEFCNSSDGFLFNSIPDVRVINCGGVDMKNLKMAFRQMTKAHYVLQYQHQLTIYRNAPNPAFYDSIAGALELSVTTPKYLAKIGLSDTEEYHKEVLIVDLLKKALKEIVFLFYGFSVDTFRKRLFQDRSDIKNRHRFMFGLQPDQLNLQQTNHIFWGLREKYSGIEPPAADFEYGFDALVLPEVAEDKDNIKEIYTIISKYQIYEQLCKESEQYFPEYPHKMLQNCDISDSSKACEIIKDTMSMGASKPSSVALESISGHAELNAGPLLNYYRPLYNWLVEENTRNNAHTGWL